MPKKLRPAVDLMVFKFRTLKVNVNEDTIFVFTTNQSGFWSWHMFRIHKQYFLFVTDFH
jgi:hypothetical protein